MKAPAPVSLSALRLPFYFERGCVPSKPVPLTADDGTDGPTVGQIVFQQAEEAWKQWKAGQFGHVSLNDGVIEYAKTHKEII